MQEVLRFHNPFWLGTPHYTTEAVTYRGYHIPKDTVVIVNAVGVLLFCADPSVRC